MRRISAEALIGILSSAALFSGGCESAPPLAPVTPQSVDVAVNNDPGDPLWAILSTDFASGLILGSKDANGVIEKIEQIIITHKRTGRVYTAQFDAEENVSSCGDDLGNLILYSRLPSELQVDYVDQDGVSGTFTIPYSNLPAPPAKIQRTELNKPSSATALPLIIPDTVGVATLVTQNGGIVDNAFVTAAVDYGDFRLGGYFYRTGEFANKYFTSFVNRRLPVTARYDACAQEAGRINQVLTVASAALFTAMKSCALLAGPTPAGGVCAFLASFSIAQLEVGFVFGSVATGFPSIYCSGLTIPADPATATVTVTAVLPSGATKSSAQTVDLHAMTNPRLLEFAIDFDAATVGDCAPNAAFGVFDFDNGIEDGGTTPYICVSGNATSPTISWTGLISNVYEIDVSDSVTNTRVWRIRIDSLGSNSQRFVSPITYGVAPTNVATQVLTPAVPLAKGGIYEVQLYNSQGTPSIKFLIR